MSIRLLKKNKKSLKRKGGGGLVERRHQKSQGQVYFATKPDDLAETPVKGSYIKTMVSHHLILRFLVAIPSMAAQHQWNHILCVGEDLSDYLLALLEQLRNRGDRVFNATLCSQNLGIGSSKCRVNYRHPYSWRKYTQL